MTKFFFTTQVFELTRDEWSNATGLPANAPAQQLVDTFEQKHLRPVLAEEENFVHVWEPQPSLDEDEQLGALVKANAATVPIQSSIAEFEDTIIAEYQITAALVTNVDGIVEPAPKLTEEVRKRSQIALGAGIVSGVLGSFLVKKGVGQKVLVGLGTGVIGVVVAVKSMGPIEAEV